MKYVIELPEDEYDGIVDSTYPNDNLVGSLIYALKNGKPLDAVLNEIRAEFISLYPKNYMGEPELGGASCVFSLDKVLEIIDKYKESESKK